MKGGTATVFGEVVGVERMLVGCGEYEFDNVGRGAESGFTFYVLGQFSSQTFCVRVRCDILAATSFFDLTLMTSFSIHG